MTKKVSSLLADDYKKHHTCSFRFHSAYLHHHTSDTFHEKETHKTKKKMSERISFIEEVVLNQGGPQARIDMIVFFFSYWMEHLRDRYVEETKRRRLIEPHPDCTEEAAVQYAIERFDHIRFVYHKCVDERLLVPLQAIFFYTMNYMPAMCQWFAEDPKCVAPIRSCHQRVFFKALNEHTTQLMTRTIDAKEYALQLVMAVKTGVVQPIDHDLCDWKLYLSPPTIRHTRRQPRLQPKIERQQENIPPKRRCVRRR
jgi:hypothetical protein